MKEEDTLEQLALKLHDQMMDATETAIRICGKAAEMADQKSYSPTMIIGTLTSMVVQVIEELNDSMLASESEDEK